MPNTLYETDGSMDWTNGVDSGKTPLLQSASNPNGLRRDQVAWLVNGTCRGGALAQRATWKRLTTIADGTQIFQGATIYEPANGLPYLLALVGGRLLRVDCLAGAAPVDLSAAYGLLMPAGVDQAYFCQGEEFEVIQAGDLATNPLFWYDATPGPGQLLRRSNGFVAVGDPTNEIPAAGPMDYYQGRLWYGQERTYSAGDIVGGAAGTAPFAERDAILHVTENPLAAGGDGFTVPTFAGNIRGLAHAAFLDTTLGTTPLFVFTSKDVYGLSVPTTRNDWIAATANNQPQQRVMQKRWGSPAARSLVAANGDIYYQTLEPGVRSLAMAVRFFNQFGNTPISRNVNRALGFNDRSLLRFGSGMLFDNRVWQTCLPYQTPVGVAHKGVLPLDFDLVSSLQDKLSGAGIPAWEGFYDGLNHLQLVSYEFGGLERAFSVVYAADGTVQLWELSVADRFENGDNRVEWKIEFPAFPFKDVTKVKELQAADIWVDTLWGTVDFTLEYKTDFDPCPRFWDKWQKCVARNTCEDVNNPICYPVEPLGEGWELPMTVGHPFRGGDSLGNRPAYKGHFFQPILTIKGYCRVRGILLYASPVEESLYRNKVS